MSNRTRLMRELESVLSDLDGQIESFKTQASESFFGRDPYKIVNESGEYVLPPLLVAKAQVLVAIADLEYQDVETGPDKPRLAESMNRPYIWAEDECPGGSRSGAHHGKCRKFGDHPPHKVS